MRMVPPISTSRDSHADRPVVRAAKLIALCTLASRVTGLLRDMLVLHRFGQSWVADAFWYAFQFPNLFRRLFGEGALAAVFVPFFTRTLEGEGKPAAWELLARTLTLLTAVLAALAVLIELVVLAIWVLATPADPALADARSLLLSLTAIMLPFMVSICVLALLSSILNCVGSFVPAALAPIALNVLMIGALLGSPYVVGGDERSTVHLLAWSVIIAGVVQLAILLPALRRAGVPIRVRWGMQDARVREMLVMLAPALVGQGALLIGTFLDTQMCVLLTSVGERTSFTLAGATLEYPLREGALTAVNAAARLYQFPLGVLVVSLATAALPAFSRMAARQQWAQWADEVRQMLRLALFEGLLAGALMIVLATPIVRMLFEYGEFDALATQRSARVLAWYGLAMWAFCAQHIVMRAFYSLGDAKTPMRIAVALIPLNLAISFALVWVDSVRESAFAISSAITSSMSVGVGLALLARRKQVALLDAVFCGAALRMLIVAGTSAGAVYVAHAWVLGRAASWMQGVPGRMLETFGLLTFGVGVYLGLAAILGLPEVRMLLRSGARRSQPDSDAARS